MPEIKSGNKINHFPVMEEGKDLSLGLQHIPAKATVQIRCDSSVCGRGCTVGSAEILVVIIIPVLGKAWAIWFSSGHRSQRQQLFSKQALEIPSKQRAALESLKARTFLTNRVLSTQLLKAIPAFVFLVFLKKFTRRFKKRRSHRDSIT